MKKMCYLIIGVLLLSIITNPSITDFKKFVNKLSPNSYTAQTHNFFVFSVYRMDGTDGIDQYHDTYIGVFGTFFRQSTLIT
jgi:hypothetical protein